MSGVKYIIEAVDKVTGPMAKVNQSFDKAAQKYDVLQSKTAKLRDEQGRFVGAAKNTEKATMSLGGQLGKLGLIGAGVGAALSISHLINYGREALKVTGQMERMQAVLSNKLGSDYAGAEAMGMIKDFAKQTPYAVEELTASYMKLVSQGFKPTMEEMRSLGDLASSMGKPFDQLAEAVLDAQTGEYERLKEFGIKAKQEGDRVSVTFAGQTTVIDKTAEAMRKYLLGLGDVAGVRGSMITISKTAEGMESNLEDAYASLANTVGEQLQPAYKSWLGFQIDAVEWLDKQLAVPIEDKIQGQIDKVYALSAELMSSNTSHARQLELLEELKKINPRIVEGIDAQNISYEALRKNIDGVVGSMKTRIMLEQLTASKAKQLTTYNEAKETADRTHQEAIAIIGQVSPELALRNDMTLAQRQQQAMRILKERTKNDKRMIIGGSSYAMGATGNYTGDDQKLLTQLKGSIAENARARAIAAELAPEITQFKKVASNLANEIEATGKPTAPNTGSTGSNTTKTAEDILNDTKGGKKGSGVHSTLNNIAAGGTRPVQINMTIHKLQDQTVIHTTTLKEGSQQAGDMVVEAVLRSLNSANAALQGQ